MKLEYGKPKECEVSNCENTRGASDRSEYHYGCVLCVFHGNEVQNGKMEIPDKASRERKQKAEDKILG